LDEALDRVRSEIPGWQAQVQFGIMVEVPSVAITLEQFAPLVDFFSIGTNDLTQYTLAVDRMNARVSALASPFHPAVLSLIERTVRVAHQYGKWVGLCGEMAGDPLATPFLLGIGLDEFSMAPAAVPAIKHWIRQLNAEACKSLVPRVLALESADAVLAMMRREYPPRSGN
jgi:phosphoenolpyruvate-protein kinase (PTS system EI component)